MYLGDERYNLLNVRGETKHFPLKKPDVQDEQNAVIDRDVEKRPLVLYSNCVCMQTILHMRNHGIPKGGAAQQGSAWNSTLKIIGDCFRLNCTPDPFNH
jgi:hypothetical protein